MADADALRALLKRVEAATGPDRVLGIDLLSTLCPDKYRRGVTDGGEDDGEVYLIEHRHEDEWTDSGWYGVEDIDPTASIDAAVALVERLLPGWEWQAGLYMGETGQSCLCAPDSDDVDLVFAPTPALALCAALLRALLTRADSPNP